MKKLLSIFTTFTAVSVVAPTVVACKTEGATVTELVKTIVAKDAVKNKAKEVNVISDAVKAIVQEELEKEVKDKLKDKKEFEAVAGIIKDKFEVTVTKETDKFKIKIEKKTWEDIFATEDSKKADQKATYELITGTSAEESVPTK